MVEKGLFNYWSAPNSCSMLFGRTMELEILGLRSHNQRVEIIRSASYARNQIAGPLVNLLAAELFGRSLSIAIRCTLREELAEWPRLINYAGDGRPSKNLAAVSEDSRKSIAEWMYPIGVEQRRRGGAIR
jgi:hypothetical protein